MRAYLLETPPLDAYGHMSMDQAVLEHGEPEAVTLRIYRWLGRPPYGVTFGLSQAYSETERAARAKGWGPEVPMVRRCTGGGVVFHDGDVTFSFVFPWARLRPPLAVYREIHRAVSFGLKALGFPARPWAPPSGRGRPQGARLQCFAGPEPEDLVHGDGTKFLGGALRRCQGRGLYQGSLRPEGFAAPPDRLRQAVIEGFSLQWSGLFEPVGPRRDLVAVAQRLMREKYLRDEWNRRR